MSEHTSSTQSQAGSTRQLRSPVLNNLRLNPFRILDVPNDVTSEEAVWKSEELLTLKRAGLPRHGDLLLPWLSDADDFEVHQAVQTIEEPLRRLVSQLFWFDLDNDASAEAFRTVLSAEQFTPPAKLVRREPHRVLSIASLPMNSSVFDTFQVTTAENSTDTQEPAPPAEPRPATQKKFAVQSCQGCGVRVVPNRDGTCPSCRIQLEDPATEDEDSGSADETPRVQHQQVKEFIPQVPAREPAAPYKPPVRTQTRLDEADITKAVASAINTANLALIHAAATLHGFSPSPSDTYDVASDVAVEWKNVNDRSVAADPHKLVADAKGNRGQLTALSRMWAHAIESWTRLLGSDALQQYLKLQIRKLDDDLVTEDDIETLVTAARVQITDFLVGEIKLLIIDGRYDLVEAMLSAVSAGRMESREWRIAFRPLRQLFDSEIQDLSSLLTDREHLRSQDLTVYMNRLESLREQWETLDADGILGLRQLVDEQIRWIFNRLRGVVDLTTLDQITPLFSQCREMAFAKSLAQEIDSYLKDISDRENWECYYCRKNEMHFESGVTLSGQKETYREPIPGGTRIHYAIRRCWVPRCSKCAKLHDFFFSTSFWIWLCLAPAVIQLEYYFWHMYDGGEFFVRAGTTLFVYWLIGFLSRMFVSARLTPKGERRYYQAKQSRIYRELSTEGYAITVNYSSGAVAAMQAEA